MFKWSEAFDAAAPWRSSGLGLVDDLPLHQIAEPFGSVEEVPGKWTDRWYLNVHDEDGRIIGIFGGGYFPYSHLVEAYACVLTGRTQLNLRALRPLNERRDTRIAVGPLTFTIEKVMEKWSFSVDDPALSVSGTFTAGGPPFHFGALRCPPDNSESTDFDHWQHFVQFGQASASVAVNGGAVREVSGRSVRDKTWGIRSRRPKLHMWFMLDLGPASLAIVNQERGDGSTIVSRAALCKASGDQDELIVTGHDLEFDRESRCLLAGRVDLQDPRNGQPFTLQLKSLGESIRGLGAGVDDQQGDPVDGAQRMMSTWDLADPTVRAFTSRGTIDTPVSARLSGPGEDYQGLGVAETAVGGSHHKYGPPLRGVVVV